MSHKILNEVETSQEFLMIWDLYLKKFETSTTIWNWTVVKILIQLIKYIRCLHETTERIRVCEPNTMGKWILDELWFELNDLRK